MSTLEYINLFEMRELQFDTTYTTGSLQSYSRPCIGYLKRGMGKFFYNGNTSLRVERCAQLHGETLNTKLFADQLARGFRENGINCDISDTPTQYLCNDAYFRMLQKTNGKAVFVHIPGSRYMTQELMAGILKTLGE